LGLPDLIELYHYGIASVDLSGMGLSDNSSLPYKYIFTGPRCLILASTWCFTPTARPAAGIHLGFSLKAGAARGSTDPLFPMTQAFGSRAEHQYPIHRLCVEMAHLSCHTRNWLEDL
jgi:hypothetical protein